MSNYAVEINQNRPTDISYPALMNCRQTEDMDCLPHAVCYNYIRQRSWANVMYSSPFVCLSVCLFVCLFVCLSVSRITQKVMDGFERNIMGR